MIQTNENGRQTLKALKKQHAADEEIKIRKACEELAYAKFTEDQVKQWSLKYKGLWYLPVLKEDNSIEALLILKPIDRHILSFATTKIEDDGLYVFLEQCMRETFVAGINPDESTCATADDSIIITDDEYFIPASQKFHKIMDNKKVAFLKR